LVCNKKKIFVQTDPLSKGRLRDRGPGPEMKRKRELKTKIGCRTGGTGGINKGEGRGLGHWGLKQLKGGSRSPPLGNKTLRLRLKKEKGGDSQTPPAVARPLSEGGQRPLRKKDPKKEGRSLPGGGGADAVPESKPTQFGPERVRTAFGP